MMNPGDDANDDDTDIYVDDDTYNDKDEDNAKVHKDDEKYKIHIYFNRDDNEENDSFDDDYG